MARNNEIHRKMSKGNDFKRRKNILKYYIKGYLDDIQIFNLFFWKLFALFIDVRSFGKKTLDLR